MMMHGTERRRDQVTWHAVSYLYAGARKFESSTDETATQLTKISLSYTGFTRFPGFNLHLPDDKSISKSSL